MSTVSDPEAKPKNVIYGLYCACHPERGIRYVGQTAQGFDQRWAEHLSNCRRGVTPHLPLYGWIKKHTIENIRFRILEAVDDIDSLDEREIFWIGFFDTYRDRRGLNLTVGGGGQRGYKFDPELVRRLAENKRGVPIHSEEHKARLSARMSGEGNPMYGRTIEWTAERRERQSARMAGNRFHPSPEVIREKTERSARRTISDEAIRDIRSAYDSGESQSSISERLGIEPSSISRIARRITWSWIE